MLLDSAYREIKALDLGGDGSLYAAASTDGRPSPARAPAPAAAPPAAGTGNVVAEVTVSESFSVVPPPAALRWRRAPGARTSRGRRRAPSSGSVRRGTSTPCGALPTTSPTPPWPPDGVLVGTGNKGKVYRVADDGHWALAATLPAEQVTALARTSGEGAALVTSNPARVFALDGTLAAEGNFLSKVKDTETVSSWGRLSWEGAAPPGTEVRLQARAGNTATPDATWTDWSPPATHAAGQATAARGRASSS